MSEKAPLLVERPRPGVLRLTINDPERRNPLSTALFRRLEAEVRSLADDVRVVVLTGAGDQVFASGADLEELGDPAGEGLRGGFRGSVAAPPGAHGAAGPPV